MIKLLKNGAYEYSEADFLGEGSFAKVYKGIIAKNNRVIAVRILPLKLIKQYGDKIKEIISGEVHVLKQLCSSDSIDYLFTTRIYDCFLTDNNVTMILEYCPDGNLQDVISQKGGCVPELEALEIMLQIARGIEFIAREKVVHRDIKPDNIFVKKEKHHTLFKIGDFGFAVKKQINQEIVGTPIFMSPEIFREQAYGSEVDVWAFGLMCHYMLFKEYYFIGATEKQIKKKVLNQSYKLKPHHLNKISQQMAGFLTGCMQMDKRKRIPATEISKHRVFDKVRNKVNEMVQQIKQTNSIIESQITGKSAKGKIAGAIMSYQFLFELAKAISERDRSSLTSLYMIKYNLGELNFIRSALRNKQNFMNLGDWNQFLTSNSYKESVMLTESIFFTHQKCFEGEYNRLMQGYSQQGPQVAQLIHKNLGEGPLSRISPDIIIPDLTQNWMNRMKGENTPEGYVRGLQCIVAFSLYKKDHVEIDFVYLEMNKSSISLKERVQIMENALRHAK